MLRFDPSLDFPDELAYRNLMDANKFESNQRLKPKSLVQNNAGSSRTFEAYTEITVEAWVRPIIDPTNPNKGCCWPILETFWGTKAGSSRITLKVGDHGSPMWVTEVFDSSDPCFAGDRYLPVSVTDALGLFNGEWHHLAGTVDASARTVNTYVDGFLVASVSCNTTMLLEGGSINIGQTQYDEPPSYLTGDLDEIRVWKVARTPTEINEARHRSLTNAELTSGNLVAYYNADNWDYQEPFNLKDLSPNGWDITMALSQSQSIPVTRLMPKILASDAPHYGSKIQVLETIRATAQWDGKYELSLFPGVLPADAATLTVQITLLPACSAPNVIIERKDTLTSLTTLATVPGDVPLVFTAPAATATTQEEDRDCFLQYNVLQGAAVLGTGYKVKLVVKTNKKPVVGDAGGAIYCDGANSFAYDKDFTFNVPNTALKYTFEWWAYNWEPLIPGTVYAVGNSEVNIGGGSWCNELRTSNKTRWDTADFCRGRLLAHAPNTQGKIQAYHSWKQLGDGAALADAAKYQQTWYHVAVTADDSVVSIYLNGQPAGSSPTFPFTGNMFRGLHMCHWTFWGPDHWFHGFLDEFRVFNHTRTGADIRSTMHQKLKGDEPGLLAYYNFDDYREAVAFSSNYSNTDPIADATKNGHMLVPGGCTPNKPPWCPLGENLCIATEAPQHPCFDSNGTSQLPGAQPSLYRSGAPVGGYGFPVVLNGSDTIATLNLAGYDPDGHPVTFEIVDIPDADRCILRINGTAATVGTRMAATDTVQLVIVNDMLGGVPSTTFSYRAFDGVDWSDKAQTIDVNLMCPPGTYLNEAERTCQPCPLGQYKEGYSFDNRCRVYSNVLWTSPIGVVITLVNTIAIFGTLAIAAAIIFFRKAKPMVAASPTFCMLIVAGALLGLAGKTGLIKYLVFTPSTGAIIFAIFADVYTYVGMPTRASCALQPLLVAVGFTLALG
ncbi:hypothetical protein HDU86_001810 [Geranomyces michiganensis]|nr:hypothetical protein HDU86_001810 [Geranomyces michiganensis]